jgi:Lon protease-like protein
VGGLAGGGLGGTEAGDAGQDVHQAAELLHAVFLTPIAVDLGKDALDAGQGLGAVVGEFHDLGPTIAGVGANADVVVLAQVGELLADRLLGDARGSYQVRYAQGLTRREVSQHIGAVGDGQIRVPRRGQTCFAVRDEQLLRPTEQGPERIGHGPYARTDCGRCTEDAAAVRVMSGM